ncbi:MAG: hypothetical protein ABIU09_13630 [Pyrinomonadaceae bacterium]
MLAKIITPIIVILVSAVAAVIFFFMLMLGLNGFNGTHGGRGLFAFGAWAVLTTLITGLLSFLSVRYLMDSKQKSPVFAALVSMPILAIAAAALNFLGFFIGLAVSEISRKNF